MADKITKAQRSYIMSRIRGRDTAPELIMRKLLRNLHFSYQPKGIMGRPDFANRNKKIAIFVDGDFWHGYDFGKRRGKLPAYWVAKIARNIKRDRKATRLLKKEGWLVLRFWEHELRTDPIKIQRTIEVCL